MKDSLLIIGFVLMLIDFVTLCTVKMYMFSLSELVNKKDWIVYWFISCGITIIWMFLIGVGMFVK